MFLNLWQPPSFDHAPWWQGGGIHSDCTAAGGSQWVAVVLLWIFFCMCVTGNASKHVSPPANFNPILSYRWTSVQQTLRESGFSPRWAMHCWECKSWPRLHTWWAEDHKFQWLSVSLEQSCWNPGECWWKQMWERCFWGNVLLVTSGDKHDYEMV